LHEPLAGETGDSRRVLVAFLRRRRTLLAALGLVLIAVLVARASGGADGGSREGSLALLLADEGLALERDSALWLPDEGRLRPLLPVVFVASREGEAPDLYYAEVRPGSGGSIEDMSWLTDLTRTSSAEEQSPRRIGQHVLYASRISGRAEAVTVLDLGGEPEGLTEDWPWLTRAQNTVTNLQETGRADGVGRRRYRLRDAAERLSVSTEEGRFVVEMEAGRIVLDPTRDEPVEGSELVELRPMAKGMPGTITWVVDTVRNLSFVGPEPIEWLEHRVFAVKDALERFWYSFAETETAAEIADDMGVSQEERRRRLALSAPDPQLGWPPPALEPVLDTRLDGEGEWIPVVDDPFLASYPGAPPAFYQSFLRVDPERPYTRAYVTVWDPRQLQLHIVTGTREPESATGETGSGMAPRDPEVLRRVVAGFNGGFQALHGEFGMMADGRVYLPPKPWAATVAVYDDGRVAMGSWVGPPEGVHVYLERWAVLQIPEHVIALRQNLTSVVEDGRFNPWERWWWGAAPLYAGEQTFIDRSALCLTEEGFLAYFWGKSMGPEALGKALLATRCVRGLHLDMNSRHTGLEFYDVRPAGAPRPPLGRELLEGEYEGPVPLAPELSLRARLMVRAMTPMRFPRYIGRDPRDFFYLTQRPVLPGPAIEAAGDAEGAGQFSTSGLPHAGWPHAFARAFLGPDPEQRAWLVRIDPRRAPSAPVAPEGVVRPLAYITGASHPDPQAAQALFAQRDLIGWHYRVGAAPAGATVIAAGQPLADVPDAEAALGVDADGFIVYVERASAESPSAADSLARAGALPGLALSDGVRLAFVVDDQFVAPDGYEREVVVDAALALLGDERPAATVLFPDVEPMGYQHWWRMQDTRVRYVREGPARFTPGGQRTVEEMEQMRHRPPPEE